MQEMSGFQIFIALFLRTKSDDVCFFNMSVLVFEMNV